MEAFHMLIVIDLFGDSDDDVKKKDEAAVAAERERLAKVEIAHREWIKRNQQVVPQVVPVT